MQMSHGRGHMMNNEPKNKNFFDGAETENIVLKLENNIGRLEIKRRIPSGRFENSFISYLVRYTLAGAFIMILFACTVGCLVAEKLSRPVIKVIERTKKIAKGDYDSSEKIPTVGILELDDLTKRSKNKLLKILNSNKIEKKLYANFFKYIVKKENKEELNELNELKELLFGDERKYKKNWNENNKNESENKNLNSNQVQNKLSKTIDVASIRKMMDANGGKINKKIINLEIKEIIDNCDENIRKKININKIREKFKENYETIIKMRENLKYKKSRIYAKFKKFIKK